MEDKRCKKILEDLHLSFQKENYHGWDLYDALLSKFFVRGSVLDSYYPRYIWTQVNKRSPINLRPLMRVPKSLNPKGLSLILRGYCALYEHDGQEAWLNAANRVCELLLTIRSKSEYYCWGSNFPYQSRGEYYEANDPGAIATSFCANAILDLYKITNDNKLRDVLFSIRKFYLEKLLLINDGRHLVFSYHIQDENITYNATAKVSESLAVISEYLGIQEDIELVKCSIQYLFEQQNLDGSWHYSSSATGKWIDNFHTGYVLVSLKKMMDVSQSIRHRALLEKGLDFHIKNHYTATSIPKYYTTSLYPIDTHCFAQSIITFTEFWDLGFATKLIDSSIDLMYNTPQRYFIYSIRKHYKVKTNLLRWCNAYMFWALANFLRAKQKEHF